MNRTQTQFNRPRPQVARAREPAQRPNTTYKNRYRAIGAILIVALIAFEIFNFDTTRYALSELLGDIRFAGMGWATILAIAFCGIDLAGLIRVFTPDLGDGSMAKEVGYLMAAWFLGATMNAMMTWYAVSITLLGHDIGNEVVSREQLLTFVPIFVAVLVWLTRVLFIGALSIAGDQLFKEEARQQQARARRPVAPTRPRQRQVHRRPVTNTRVDQPLVRRPREQHSRPTYVATATDSGQYVTGSRIQ